MINNNILILWLLLLSEGIELRQAPSLKINCWMYITKWWKKVISSASKQLENKIWFQKADVDMLAESMTTPPAVHILTARSTQEVD
jgi:hypothetical protein